MTNEVLFIQGGGEDAHDKWDNKIVESLERELGSDYAIRYPQMPDEADPKYAAWMATLKREFAKLEGFEASFKYITKHPRIVTQDISDSILAEAFSAQLEKREKYAKNCVVQALMIQYAVQLGRDGISLFFNR